MAAFYCTTTRIIFVFLFIFKIGSPEQESKTLKDPGHSSKMTPSCKWPIQQEKIDVDRQVTRPREIYFGDGVRLLWKTVRTSEKFLATSFSVFYKFKFIS